MRELHAKIFKSLNFNISHKLRSCLVTCLLFLTMSYASVKKSRTSKGANRRSAIVDEEEWMETIDKDNRRIFLPQEPMEPSPSQSTVKRSSASASPSKRARFLSPERDTVLDIPDDLPYMGDEVNDPSVENKDKGGHGVKPVRCLYILI
jgi:hypothetical protein